MKEYISMNSGGSIETKKLFLGNKKSFIDEIN